MGTEPDVQRIPAHSAILADASPVFRAMFAGEMARRQQQQQHPARVTAAVHCPPGGGAAKSAVAGGSSSGSNGGGNWLRAAAVGGGLGSSQVAPTSTVAVSDVDGRAFDVLLR